ncbi:hypothetical protein CSUI_003732 [Cystoisospora suis]|uniref:Uncharacterized protein n=1 Tax=Cystoisospora suis TaxID=483139 RepID=A0A2C6L373_9APIC|nr:hypothetical protein CSUI_003732 [Cystoisospora suis]
MATVEAQSVQYIIDPTPVDDEGILTLIELDSKHPDIITANTRIQKFVLDSANAICAEAANLERKSRQKLQEKRGGAGEKTEGHSSTSPTLEEIAGTAASVYEENRQQLADQMKQCRVLLDACNRLVFDLDNVDFSCMKVIWGDERSVRQSRKHLTQLIEKTEEEDLLFLMVFFLSSKKITDKLEAVNRFLKKVSSKLSPLPSTPSPVSSSSPSSSSSPFSSSATTDIPVSSVGKPQLDTKTESTRTNTGAGVDTASPSCLSKSDYDRREEKSEGGTKRQREERGEEEEEQQGGPGHWATAVSSGEQSGTSSARETQLGERDHSSDVSKGACLVAGNLLDGEARRDAAGGGGGIGRGRGRGDVPPGSGRGRGLLLSSRGRGRGGLAPGGRGRGTGEGPPSSDSSSDSEGGGVHSSDEREGGARVSSSSLSKTGVVLSESSQDTPRHQASGTAPTSSSSTAVEGSYPNPQTHHSRSDGASRGEKKHGREEREDDLKAKNGDDNEEKYDRWGNKRWKRKPASNVDWLLKCRTKLCELKERTVRKAVSDVFIKNRTVQETIDFMNHNFKKLQVVADKPRADITPEDRRVFMQSIESYIAGLDKACALIAKQAMNKRQLMNLHESACKIEKLQTPSELVEEMKSTISLLQTFAFMPPSRDSDSD